MKAVKKAYPGDKNSSTTLNIWRKYKLWPPTEEILNGKSTEAFGDDNSRNQGRNGLTVITGHKKRFGLSDLLNGGLSVYSPDSPELPEKEILRQVRKILDTIEVHHKEWTGGRLKKYSMIKTRIFAGRLPVDLLNEIHKFKGSNTYHLERALRLYVKVMGTKG